MTTLLFALTLAAAVDFVPVAGKPSDASVADLNNDGRPDLVAICGEEVVTLLNFKTGWREATRTAVPRPPVEMALADFNRDGRTDVAIADHDTFAVYVLMGDGQGGWRDGTTVRAKATGTPHIHGLLAGDLNGDRAPDLIFASSGEGEIITLLNDGKGAFQPAATAQAARNAWHPALGDFNGDGRLDVAVASFNGNTIAVLLGDGKGAFAPAAQHRVFDRPFLVKTADLNGDGHQDIYGVHDDHGRLTILLGDGKGGFRQSPASPIDIGREAYGVEAIDLDGDERLDLVTAAGPELRVFQQSKAGVFSGPVTRAQGVGSFKIASADFDGDGRKELAIADGERGRITFFR